MTGHYKNALKLLKIKDLKEQQQIFDDLQDRWQNLTAKITALQNKATEKFINSDIPVDQKLTSIEKELNELDSEFSSVPEDAHNEEEFQFYCHKAQVCFVFRLQNIMNFARVRFSFVKNTLVGSTIFFNLILF